ncbi:MAG: sugar-binding domain-containing protein, partial [Dorea sp.]
ILTFAPNSSGSFCPDSSINFNPIDQNTNVCSSPDEASSESDELLPHAAHPNTIAVASGVKKAEGIRASLKTGCIDTLIVDETTARLILEEA